MTEPVHETVTIECATLCRFLVGEHSAEQDPKNWAAFKDWTVAEINYYPDGRVRSVKLAR